MSRDAFHVLRDFPLLDGTGRLYSLPALEQAGLGAISRLPVSLRIVLESVLRNCDGAKITEDHVRQLAGWQARSARSAEIPFVVARVLLQDFTGVPLLCDLAAMRSVAQRLEKDPTVIEPRVPMDLVIDHSVQIDVADQPDALDINMRLEFQRNHERYRFIKWGMQAFDALTVVPPGIGIVHQVNLEHLARGVWHHDDLYYPDTVVGTDSHTTMINALGVVGWGVGGIEAEAGMLGQPLYFLTPDVVGVCLKGALCEGVTATDLVLRLTELLRAAKVVGAFVEFFGEGAASLTVPDRATIANMAPEYGATIGFFPIDRQTIAYLEATGRSTAEIAGFQAYFTAQKLFGMPAKGDIDYTKVLELDLASVVPSVSGPKRPQDRIALPELKNRFSELFSKSTSENGYGKPAAEMARRYPIDPKPVQEKPNENGNRSAHGLPIPRNEVEMIEAPQASLSSMAYTDFSPLKDLGHGDILIAAITSCTNTSNPGVMLAAGLLAKKAVARGLSVNPRVKTSLAPGSRVVTAYLENAGLLSDLERLGFRVSAYGCTTCIGNSGPLDAQLEEAVVRNGLVCAAVLSGNRNFEARIHASIRANFLMSPPLVVAFAIAGTTAIDLTTEPLGTGQDGRPVFLRDIWPTRQEIDQLTPFAHDPAVYRERYRDVAHGNPLWDAIPTVLGDLYAWVESSYIAEPPFFAGFSLKPDEIHPIANARALAIFGDSVTTDHISPAGAISRASPAGRYLLEKGVSPSDFNSYGSRRGNHQVMVRGTFANVRIRNLMLPPRPDGTPVEGGITLFQPDGRQQPIYDVAMRYREQGTAALVFAGAEYGTGSSRDWAAKGTQLLGVRAVVARSFERIHRSNLVGMGVLPLQFTGDDDAAKLGIRGDEQFDITGLDAGIRPNQDVRLVIKRDGGQREATLKLRIDTPIEVEYHRHGGILPFALRELLGGR